MLELHGVTKAFGEHRVLEDVSMQLPSGTLTGFVGANGAGKTTTMRIVMGLLEADAGQVTWNGSVLTTEQRRNFGYMPEERGLYQKQPVREQLVYFARLHHVSAQQAVQRADELLGVFGLADRADDKLEELSLGNQQRVQIAVALMHRPQALVLDEPFSGLDPDAVEAMGRLVRSCADDGVPVLFSSHQLDLVERLCDEIVIIAAGRIVAAGSAEQLRASHETVIRIDAPDIGSWIGEADGVTVRRKDPESVLFVPVVTGSGDALLRRALSYGPVSHYGEVVVPLSEIYKEATR